MTRIEKAIRTVAEAVLEEVLSAGTAKELAATIASRASGAVLDIIVSSLSAHLPGRPKDGSEKSGKPEAEVEVDIRDK